MKKLILALTLILALNGTAGAVPQYDNGSGAPAPSGSNVDTISFSFTTSGSNRYLNACLVVNSTTATFNAVTYNSVAVGNISTQIPFDNSSQVSFRGLVNPATGSNTFQANISELVDIEVGLISFTGVHQTVSTGTVEFSGTGGADTSTSIAVGSANDELVVDCFRLRTDESVTMGGGQTERYSIGSNKYFSGSTEAGGSPTVAMSRTWSSNAYFLIFGISLKPSAAAAPTVRRGAMVLE